jgi:signal transduction histidine kinase
MAEGANKQSITCAHREEGKLCPISKTPCLGECIYANILDDISLGIVGLDVMKEEVFQNKLAVSIFKETIKPKDYGALVSLLIPGEQSRLPQRTSRAAHHPIRTQVSRVFNLPHIRDLSLDLHLGHYRKMRLNSIAEAVNTMNNFGYIFSGIRHELGNPINSIKTSMTVCKKNLQTYSRETISEFIDRVLSDLVRVEALLKDLKNFSMYENPECREVYIASFMDNLLAMVERDFSVNRIRIKTFISPAAERGLFDARALQHVMLNILTNAFDALEGVESPEITISTFNAGDRVIIRIKDNGKGIPEAQKKHLFQPFSTTKKHGTGLGLVIVKKMMLKMNGMIEIESRENAGTRVMLNLPANQNRDA